MLLIVVWFALLTPDLLLPLTQFLIFFCRDWSSSIKSSSYFRKFYLHLHYTIGRPLINPWLPWSSATYCLLIFVVDHISIAPTDPVPGLFLSSLVFWYQIFIIFPKTFPCTCTPQLIDPLLIPPQMINPWLVLGHPGLLMLIFNNLP